MINVLTFGKHSGRTYDDVITNHPDYVTWLREKGTAKTKSIVAFLDYAASSASTSGGEEQPKYKEARASEPREAAFHRSTTQFGNYHYPRHETSSNTSSSHGAYAKAPWTSYSGTSPPWAKKEQWTRKEGWSSKREFGGANFQKASKGSVKADPIRGTNVITFGKKHAGKSYESVFQDDQKFCKYLVDLAKEEAVTPEILSFVAYCQQRWLQPSTNFKSALTVEAPENALSGQIYCLTGKSVQGVTRDKLEECIQFFGGTVRAAVSGKTTFLLIVSREMVDGRSTEESVKYLDARNKGIPILHLDAFLEQLKTTSGGKGAQEANLMKKFEL